MVRPLEAMSVIDIGRYITGPCCGTLLADFGAAVIRAEKRDGDHRASPRKGAVFLQMNRNKEA